MKYYTPDVPLSKWPQIDMIFQTLDQALGFYLKYTKLGGFTVGKTTQVTKRGLITLKYFFCSKEGYKTFTKVDTLKDPEASDPTKQRRNRPSIRTGCHVHLKLSLSENNTYKVYAF